MYQQYINVLGTRIDPINTSIVFQKIDEMIANSKKGYITLTGIHGIMESQKSNKVKEAYRHSFLSVPDGMPLVYIGKVLGFPEIQRCYGPDLMMTVMEYSVKKGYSHFLYGGKEGIAVELRDAIKERFPSTKIVGTFTPPFRPLNYSEKKILIGMIDQLKPDIIWVGLGAPKQEIFMYEYLPHLKTKLMIGVGAAFDIHTGKIKSAPSWMQKLALEWLYRLIQEPHRLWKRYLINNPLFIYNYILQVLSIKKFD